MTNVEQRDGVSRSAETISANGTFSRVLEARGAKVVNGIVEKSSSYDIDLVWEENDGTDIIRESVASAVSGQTEFSEDWHTVNRCRIEISDNSGSEEDAAVSVNVT